MISFDINNISSRVHSLHSYAYFNVFFFLIFKLSMYFAQSLRHMCINFVWAVFLFYFHPFSSHLIYVLRIRLSDFSLSLCLCLHYFFCCVFDTHHSPVDAYPIQKFKTEIKKRINFHFSLTLRFTLDFLLTFKIFISAFFFYLFSLLKWK